jgi:uncharacterized protein YjgD (DUF1641 family)
MAQPIPLPVAQPETNATDRVENAVANHADAIVSALELLQLLHDRGVLDFLRGIVGAGDHLVGMATAAAATPESQRAMRNFILLSKFFGTIPPEVLKSMVSAVERGAQRHKDERAPSLLELMRRLRQEDTRHALSVTLDLLDSIGKGL